MAPFCCAFGRHRRRRFAGREFAKDLHIRGSRPDCQVHDRYDMTFSTGARKVTAGLAAAFMAIGIAAYAQGPASVAEIQMTAQKYDFKPDTITVKKGDRVKLVITSVDRDHGLKIDAFRVNQKLPKGQPVTVEFTADQAGTFPFECSQFCGLGHKKMKGKLQVE